MSETAKTKKQLMDENAELRRKLFELTEGNGAQVSDRSAEADGMEGVFRAYFLDSADIMLVIDFESGTIVQANPAIERILDYKPGDLHGKHFSVLFPSPPEASREDSLDRMRIYGSVFEAQHLLHADGSTVPMDLQATIIPWQGKSALLATFRDVRDRESAVLALRESEEQMRTLINAMPDLVYFKDGEGRWLHANDFTLSLFDLESVDYKGKTDAEIAVYAPFYKDSLTHFEMADTDAFEHTGISRCDEVVPRPDGSSLVLDTIRVPVFRDDGGHKGLVVIGRDITARKEAEQELKSTLDELELRVERRTAQLAETNERLRQEIGERRRAERQAKQSEERLRAIFETAQDCIYIKDKSLRYTLVNPSMEQMLGMTATDIIGKKDADLFGAGPAEHMKEVDTRVLNGELIEQEHTMLVQGAATTLLDVRAPMRTRNGEITGLCGISRNITERQRKRSWTPAPTTEFKSATMRSTMSVAELAAQGDSIVLLTGESGTGKDYLARYIHDKSKRAGGPFFAINCAAVARELAESELFGHEPGAFTGAQGRARGLLELAEGGTLLLNEIGELSPPLQAKLLTFLDTRSFTRVGGRKTISVSARIMAATNRDLEKEVSNGKFRADLFYRLNVMSIRIPPLRERIADIELLVEQILREIAGDLQLQNLPEIDIDTMKKFYAYRWPGNVRELRNVLERGLIISQGQRIEPPENSSHGDRTDWAIQVRFPDTESLNDITKHVKRSLIEEALLRSGGSRKDAAELLNISRHALHRQLKSLGISDSDGD